MSIESKNTPMSVEKEENKPNSSKQLIKRRELKGTPFTIITVEGKSFGVLGNHRITKEGEYKEIKRELTEFTWDRVMQVVIIALQEQNKINEMINNLTQEENGN